MSDEPSTHDDPDERDEPLEETLRDDTLITEAKALRAAEEAEEAAATEAEEGSEASGSEVAEVETPKPAIPRREPRPWYWPRGSRRGQRWALILVAISIAVVAWLGVQTYRQIVTYPDRPLPGSPEEIVFEVPPGSSFAGVLDLLVEHDVVPEDEASYFKLFVLQQGAANKTTAGEHRFRGDMTPTEVLAELQRRQPVQEVRVTIPEGKHILEVAQILADAGLSDADTLEAAMRDEALIRELGIQGPTVEGYLFPDTYKFDKKATAEDIIRRLVERHRQVFAEVRRRHRAKAKDLEADLGWGDREVVILASLVEKETAVPSERPLIAGVFINRMSFSSFQPKKLQTDPTIIYGCTVPEKKSAACEKFEGRIRTIHLRDKDNPYSTYAIEGLPPGPIANPGREALEAALSPTKSRYLFFVAKGDGSHYFSKTEQEHERMVDKYIRGKG